jgi:cephalosporin-C deacetylase-like acetyl esterase
VRGAGIPSDVRALRPTPTRPGDYRDFWASTGALLASEDPDVRTERLDRSAAVVHTSVSFRSLHGARIHGYCLRWTDDRPRPLVVHAHGYNSVAELQRTWSESGCHVVGFDVRGFGRSRAAVADPSPAGWVVTGLQSPETSVLRGAVCDYARALEISRPLIEGQVGAVSRLVAHGHSFAGGLAVLADGAAHATADLLALGVPTFGWFSKRRSLRPGGSAAELNAFVDGCSTEEERRLTDTLAYFDAVNAADQVRAPAVVGLGRIDPIVPAETVYAIVNHLRVDHEVWELPVSHSEAPEEARWSEFERRWQDIAFGRAVLGSDAEFGSRQEAVSPPL